MNTTVLKTIVTGLAAVLVPLASTFLPGNALAAQAAFGLAGMLLGWVHAPQPGTAAKIEAARSSVVPPVAH